MNIKTLLYGLLLFTSLYGFSKEEESTIKIYDLRTEMLKNPEGIDVLSPHLSWKIAGKDRGLTQVAFRILVASSPEKLASGIGDLWDSGKQKSSNTVGVRYQGKKLTSSQDRKSTRLNSSHVKI